MGEKVAELLKADGSSMEVTPKDGRRFNLDELQTFVGGYIEIVTLRDGRLMVLNEEGKLKGLPRNLEATRLWHRVRPDDDVVGDVLICSSRQIE